MGTFALDLQKFAEKAKGNGNAVVRETMFEIATMVEERSAVGDPTLWKHPAPKGYIGGRFRANWQLGVNVIPDGTIDGIDPDGAATLGVIAASIPAEPAGNILYLANNLPYAQLIEDGTGPNNWMLHAAPAGVVSRTAMEFRQIVDEAAAGVAK